MTKDKSTTVYFDRETLQFMGITDEIMNKLHQTYPTVDIDAELKKMAIWLSSSKGKGRKGTISFIMNWLSGAPSQIKPSDNSATPISPALERYLKDLWKDREYLLEMNTLRR